ncbi:MAG: MBL fold metallo-hydrolase [Pseudomonadota bacterium]|nr:MBL fold metallo-hydrolase [Pseudomonadota bacterium]
MDQSTVPRRRFLAGVAGLAGGLAGSRLTPVPAAAQPVAPAKTLKGTGLELVLLGTKGGPRPGGPRSNPGYVFLVDGTPYVVDCGPGVPHQLVRAGVALPSIRRIFITHHHSDHNAEYGNVFFLAWASGLRDKVKTYGPPPIKRMTELFWELNRYDVEIRIADEGRVDPRPLVEATEFDGPGVIYQDEKVRVTAALVNHPPVIPAFAYRFDTRDRSIVFSGDTTADDRLIALARGADVLVHEVLYVPGVDKMLARVPNAATLKEHLIASHTPTYDLGRVAREAQVKTLVLTHLVPGDDLTITDEMWTADVRKDFAGEIIVGQDLMVV